MEFSEVCGHQGIKQLLTTALQTGHIGHAYLFEGPAGVGKYSMASAFAAAIVGGKSERHPDIITVTNQLYDENKKQENLLVDTIRQMRKDVYIMPYTAARKVYILPHADSMNTEAQNSLLKVFEEPPAYCTIVLLAENANALLPTIRSRAVLVHFHPLPPEEVEAYLLSHTALEPAAAALKARMSDGCIGRALTLAEDAAADALRQELLAAVINLCEGGNRPLYDFVLLLKRNKDALPLLFAVLRSWFRDVLHIKQIGKTAEVINADQREALLLFCSKITRAAAYACLAATAKYERIIAANANYPIAVLCMATEYWEEIHGRNYRSTIQ